MVYIMAEGQPHRETALCLGATTASKSNPSTFGFILEPLHLNQTDAVERLVTALDEYVARVGQVTLLLWIH